MLNNKINGTLFVAFILCFIGALTAQRYINNFIIFISSFSHFSEQKHLYHLYPEEYHDYFLYGPIFTILIAPFKLIPISISKVLWSVLNFSVYAFAIKKLLKRNVTYFYIWFILCFQDIYLSGLSFEINNLMVAIIIIVFIYIQRSKEFISGILVGLFSMIKIFPIASLMFLSFNINRKKYILGILVGILIAIIVPMLFTNYDYTLNSLKEWLEVLSHKDHINRQLNNMVDYSFPGIIRKTSSNPNLSSFYFLFFGCIIALVLFIKNYLRQNLKYELLVFSILSILVFNSNSESPSFIISSTAVAIWWIFVVKEKNRWEYFLIILYFLFSVLPTIDFYPKYIRDEYLHGYSLRALPPTLIWFHLVFKAIFKK